MKLELARSRGICADFNYTMPENALRDLSRGYACTRDLLGEGDLEKPVLFLDNLKLILFKILENLMNRIDGEDPIYGELFRYVHSGDPRDQKEVNRVRSGRLFDLADSIAGLFYHYGMNCRALVSPWEKGQTFPHLPEALKKHELWQRHLWNLLFHPGQPYLHLSQILAAVMESEDSYEGPIKNVGLFGSSFLGDTGLNFFHHLSRDIRVDHFILSPSRIYSDWDGRVRNPLLKSWSTLIGGFATLSGNFDNPVRQEEYIPGTKDSLLHTLQKHILEDTGEPDKRAVSREDGSLVLHTFTSRWREVEVLKDLILNALNDDETLNLTDLCILAPDINEYAPFLDALFPSVEDHIPRKDHLPYNVVDLAGTSDSPFLQGFLHLFTLPGERFSRKDLFLLFDNPCFCETFQINRAERDFFLDLCETLNIKWGMNRAHKQDFYPEATDFNSWEEGFRRLADGFFFEEEDDPGLPLGLQDETGNQSAGKLMGVVENLFHDFYELNRIKLPLEQWVLMAEALMESYLTPRDGEHQDSRDRWRLKGTFRDLITLSEDAVLSEEGKGDLDFTVFRILLTEFIQKSGSERGRYLTQGVTCSSLKPLRAIPFRRIYVLGLNETAFPGEDLQLSFDLREVVQQTIDLSRRGSDKYAFLETLLSTRDALTLFFHDRDPVRGEALQPSILISELLEYLDGNFTFPDGKTAEQQLVHRESIHDYDSRYFSGEGPFRSFNRTALKNALTASATGKGEPMPPRLSRALSEKSNLITLRDLEQFLKNPAAYYFKNALGIFLQEDENAEEESQENWESSFVDRYRYLSGILESPGELQDRESLDRFLEDQQIRGILPDSQLIFLEEDFFRSRLEDIRDQLEEKGLTDGLSDPRDYLIAPEESPGQGYRDEELHPPVIIPRLFLELPGGEDARFSGLLEELSPSPEEPGLWETLEYCESGEPGVRHYLKAFLKALLMNSLSCQGWIGDFRQLRLYQVGKRSYPSVCFCLSVSEPGKDDILLPDSDERLAKLAAYCFDQKENPVMLYPEIGEALAEKLTASPSMSDKELLEQWRILWKAKSDPGSFGAGHSPFANCPYRRQFLPDPPETDPVRLRELLETVYLPFRQKGELP